MRLGIQRHRFRPPVREDLLYGGVFVWRILVKHVNRHLSRGIEDHAGGGIKRARVQVVSDRHRNDHASAARIDDGDHFATASDEKPTLRAIDSHAC